MNDPAASEGHRATFREAHRVLIVDDYADSRELFRDYLDIVGFDVDVACDAETALERVRLVLPDLILMDVSLPVMDGWEAIKRLKEDPRTRAVPVIALTGHALPEHVARAREVGCADFCSKPCLPEDVEARIRKLLEAVPLRRVALATS